MLKLLQILALKLLELKQNLVSTLHTPPIYRFMRPENPKKAIDIKLAAIIVAGKPLKLSGMSANSNLSLIPANKTIAKVNHIPAPNPFTIVSTKL